MATFLIAHGAWSAGWAWKKMRPLMHSRGHELFTPTYTGIGERLHLADPSIGLRTHVADMLGMIEAEDLRRFILVGHSYGGMVATAVADRVPERVAHLVYLDAFVPRDGESLFDLQSEEVRARMREAARASGDGWRVPPNPSPPDTSAEDLEWIGTRRVSQPIRTLEEPVRLSGAVESLPRTYVYCTRRAPGDPFRRFAERAKSEPGWTYVEIDASHSPQITAPGALMAVLDEVSREGAAR